MFGCALSKLCVNDQVVEAADCDSCAKLIVFVDANPEEPPLPPVILIDAVVHWFLVLYYGMQQMTIGLQVLVAQKVKY